MYRLAWEYCIKSSILIVSVSCFSIMEAQTGVPSIAVNKKDNLSVSALSESLKRYKYEDVSNRDLMLVERLTFQSIRLNKNDATFSSIFVSVFCKKKTLLWTMSIVWYHTSTQLFAVTIVLLSGTVALKLRC